jgi:O-antigen ligase/tetratricopeptide (TPR) repeat protein
VPRLLARAGFQAWIFGFIFFFGAEAVLLEPQLRIFVQLAYGVPLVAWALLRVRRRPDRVDLAVMLALLAYLVVSLASRDRTGSLETLGLVATYALLFWVLRDVARSDSLRPLVASAVAISMALSLAFNAFLLIQEKVAFFSVTGRLPELEGLTVFPWETVNALPVLVLVALPFVAWMPRGGARKVALGVIAVSAVIVIPISNGHAGYIGLGVAGLVFALLSPMPRHWFGARSSRTRGLLVGGATAVVLLGALGAVGPFVDALHSSGRTDLYAASLAMIGDRPLLGSGPSTFSWVRLITSPEAARLVSVRLTHDVPLQTLLDGGLLLGATFLGVVGTWLRGAVRWTLPIAPRASVAALSGYAAAVTLDDFSFLPAVTVMLVCLAAWSLPSDDASSTERRLPTWLPAAVAAATLLVAVSFVVRVDVARVAAANGRAAAVSEDWTAAAASFETATSAHAEDGGYWLGLGQARAELGERDAAIAAYEAARGASPGDARSYGALAALSTEHQDRIALLRRAADLSIGDPQYGYRLGLELAAQGDVQAATEAWGTAVTLRSDLFGVLPFGAAGVDPGAVAQAALRHIAAKPQADADAGPDARWNLALALRGVGSDAPVAWLAVDAARHGDASAAATLANAAVDQEPTSPRSYQALAAVEAFACNPAARDEALRKEAATRYAYHSQPSAVAIHREYAYREDSTGSMQPPGATALPEIAMWPWSLIPERPECGS